MNTPNGRHAVTCATSDQAFASDGTGFNPRDDLWAFRTLSGPVNIDFTMLHGSVSANMMAAAKRTLRLVVETRNLQSARAAFLQFRHLTFFAHQRQGQPVKEIDAEDIAYWCAHGNSAYIG